MSPPGHDQDSGFGERVEDFAIGQFITQWSVEALAMATAARAPFQEAAELACHLVGAMLRCLRLVVDRIPAIAFLKSDQNPGPEPRRDVTRIDHVLVEDRARFQLRAVASAHGVHIDGMRRSNGHRPRFVRSLDLPGVLAARDRPAERHCPRARLINREGRVAPQNLLDGFLGASNNALEAPLLPGEARDDNSKTGNLPVGQGTTLQPIDMRGGQNYTLAHDNLEVIEP